MKFYHPISPPIVSPRPPVLRILPLLHQILMRRVPRKKSISSLAWKSTMRGEKVSMAYLSVITRTSISGLQCVGEEGRGYALLKLNCREFQLTAAHHHQVTRTPAQVVLKFHWIFLKMQKWSSQWLMVLQGSALLPTGYVYTWTPIASRTRARSRNSNNN